MSINRVKLKKVILKQQEILKEFNLNKSIIQASKLSKSFKNFELKNIDIELNFGEIITVVGQNGNGKTTLLRILAGELAQNSGELNYPFLNMNGLDWYYIKQNIAYIPQRLEKWHGTLENNIRFSASIKGINGVDNDNRIDFILNRLGLDNYRNHKWDEISGGYQMRFELAKALVWYPKLIILDEPLAHLDINTQQLFLQDLRDLANSIRYPLGVVISSQHIEEVEAIADKTLFIKKGEAKYYGKTVEFGDKRVENIYELKCFDSSQKLLNREKLYGIFNGLDLFIEDVGQFHILETNRDISAKELLTKLIDNNSEVIHFKDISKSTKKLFRIEYGKENI